jgi:alpha-L-rhamnosidase
MRWGLAGAALTAVVVAAVLAPTVVASAAATGRPGAPAALTVDDLAAPVGLAQDDVFFGWHVVDPRPGAVQTAYRIVVSRPVLAGAHQGTAPVLWDSGRVTSRAEAFVAYRGPALAPDTTYRWTVQTWDGAGLAGPFAPAATFDTGLPDGAWHADWIKRVTVEPEDSAGTFSLQSGFGVWENKDEYTYVRKEATLERSPIVRARAYVSADQQYELYVNGVLAGKGQAYQFPDSQYYETHDITHLLHAGAPNAFGIVYNWQGPGKGRPAGTPGVIAQISILHADGSSELVTTDGSWRVLPGAWLPGTQRDEEGDPVDYTENIDGPAEPIGWDRPGFLDAAWALATVIGPHPVAPWTHLVPARTRIVYEPVHAVSLHTLPSGAVVADFGKVYAAIPEVTFHHGSPGHLLTMRAGFLLDPSGSVSATRGTQHTDMGYSYIQRGGTETFRPFDYLGFRYFQIDDPGEQLSPADVVMLTRHVALPDEQAATFTSSDPTVDAVFDLGAHSALFTMQEQFVDTPTREKGSWLGDGRNESQTAMDAFGDVNETRKSLLEFAQSQARYWPNGAINKIYPTALGAGEIPEGTEMYPEWVWDYWLHTGDRAALAALYPVVAKVSAFLWSYVSHADGLLTNIAGATDGFQFPTDTALNILAVNVFHRVADMGEADGRPAAEVALERGRAASVTAAINARLVAPDGTYLSGLDAGGHPITSSPTSLNAFSRQSVNAFALEFGVVPPTRTETVARYVAGLGMSTPPIFAGDLLEGLRAVGDDRTILHLLTDRAEPGWANVLARGGTFGWEVWNPDDRDVVVGGTFVGSLFGNGDSMSHGFSSNVLVAIQQALLGVVPTAPGYADFDVTPPLHVLTHAEGTVPTPYGPIAVRWSRTPGGVEVDVAVPPGTTATVHVPTVAAASLAGAYETVTVGAGAYRFTGTPARTAAAPTAASPTGAGPQAAAVVAPAAGPSVARPPAAPRLKVWIAALALGAVAALGLLWRRAAS